VTGGTRGIGFGICQCLIESGFDLAVNDLREKAEVADILVELRSGGADVIYCQADIASDLDRQRMLSEVKQHFSRLDSLINNAGVAPIERADLLHASEESFDRLIGINLKGPYFLTQLAGRWMAEQSRSKDDYQGSIINISSISATVASVNRGDYCISKAGVAMATQLWAARMSEFGVSVYEVRPGVIRTEMTDGVTEKYDRLINDGLTIDRRWGTTEDVGKAVASLARGEFRYATGNVIMIDGGLTRQRL
jgi:NAD(P)-dependent dehydrogenase (short-subunit alcohol dehydrogenase family)